MNNELNNMQDAAKDISLLIENSKQQIARSVNATMSQIMYWQIGAKIIG